MPKQVKLLLVVLVVAMVGAMVYVSNNAVTGPDQSSLSKPTYVDRFIPTSGSNVLSQATVGIDLAEGYDAYLVINGIKIDNNAGGENLDGLRRAPSLGTIEYDPAPGRRIERLNTPDQCVDAFVWKVIDGPATAVQLGWCFQVS